MRIDEETRTMAEQSAEKQSVGFIGLGIMGRPMARNVLAAGYDLVVYDLMSEPIMELVGAGATAANSPAEVAEAAEVVLLCLPDSPDVEEAMTGRQGLLAGTHRGQIVVDMSTISPVTARAMAQKAAEQGVILLDAPVSGGQVGALN